jgi:hypothetical protein
MTALVDRHTHGAHNLPEAADYLYRLRRNSPNVGLTRATALLERLGNPQNAVPTVHVAGTAGKGSVSAFTSALLTAHGFRVGTHLSPHVRSILERFQINGASVCAADFVGAVRALGSAVESLAQTAVGEPTFFEALNAVAFTRFAEAELDYAVVETGLGGLLDATNTIQRHDKLAVLTRIGIDHTKVLGPPSPRSLHTKPAHCPPAAKASSYAITKPAFATPSQTLPAPGIATSMSSTLAKSPAPLMRLAQSCISTEESSRSDSRDTIRL